MPDAAVATINRVPPRSVLSFPIDMAAVGGLSLCAIALVAATGAMASPADVFERFIILGTLINAPHFIASYALLYGSREMVGRYRSVSMGVPALLVLWVGVGMLVYLSHPEVLKVLCVLASVLLAWHYTGQSFGMMASYGFVEGVSFKPNERRLLRANLFALLGWHVLWALSVQIRAGATEPGPPELITRILHVATPIAAASSLLGVAALVQLSRRIGRLPGPRLLLPWLAVHGWYALMAIDDRALFLAQISHALQYLPFPLRVHLNRTASSSQSPLVRSAIYLGALLVVGQAGFVWLPALLDRGVAAAGWNLPPMAVLVVTMINVHHYFVDGVVWKISNPAVRKDLFAHLAPPATVAPAAGRAA